MQPDHADNVEAAQETLLGQRMENQALGAPRQRTQRPRLSQIEEEMATALRSTPDAAKKDTGGQFTSAPPTHRAPAPADKPSSEHPDDNEDSEYSQLPSSEK